MSKLQNAKDYLQKAHDIRQGSASFVGKMKDHAQVELDKINQNQNLSAEGRIHYSQEVKSKFGVELLQQSHTRKQEYLTHVQKAHKIADEAVYAALKKPDDTKLGRFESDLRAFKMEIMLTPNPDRAMQKLSSFIEKLDDAYLANQVRETFTDIASPIITKAGGDSATYQLQLAQTFRKLQSDFETPEIKEAREILETANDMTENPKLYPGFILKDFVTAFAGREYAEYLDKTDEFFAKAENATHKPADYVDPAAEETKKAPWWQQMPDNPTFNPQKTAEAGV